MGEKIEALKAYMARPIDLRYAAALLNWDEEVYMPEEGVNARAEQLATLQSLAHEMLTAEEMGRRLEAAEVEAAALDYDSDDASLVRVARRDYDQSVRLPTELVERESRAISQAFAAWRQARVENDFPRFAPHLQTILDISLEKAERLGYTEHPYDALLDLFEPGMKTAQVEALFGELKAGLLPIVRQIAAQPPVDDAFFSEQTYPAEKQLALTLLMLRDIGYNFKRGRQDEAPHPFTTSFAVTDVRVTTRVLPNRPQSVVFSSIHEGGHALYDQGIPEKFDRTALVGGTSLGMHESQSRMWENQVGRSRAFWSHYYPIMRAFFINQLSDVPFEAFYRALNKVEPSLIRVEADEVTYNFHIFVRFELEKELITGKLKVQDVPEAWNSRYQEYLGITPPNDAVGCLQDIHWSHGTIGYFPTYTLGNLISAQLYQRIRADIPGVEDGFARAEFAPLLDWLRRNVHAYARKFTAPELLQRVLGQEIQVQPLLDHIRETYSTVYDLK